MIRFGDGLRRSCQVRSPVPVAFRAASGDLCGSPSVTRPRLRIHPTPVPEPPGRPNYHPWETKYTGGVTQAASRLDFSPLWRLASVRLPMRLPAAVRGACGRPSTQAALSKFFLRAGAKLAENDGKKFSNFSRSAKNKPPRGCSPPPPAVPERVKNFTLLVPTL